MATKTYKNAFAKFASTSEKVAYIKALDAEVKYRPLTMDESDNFNARLIKGYDKDGGVDFDYTAANDIKYEKVALCLIEPKMSIDELKALSAGAVEAVTEINALIDGVEKADEKKD